MSYHYFEMTEDFTASQTRELSFPGATSLEILDLVGTLEIQIDNGVRSNARKGTGFQDQAFEKVRFTEKAGSTASVLFAISSGKINDSRFTATAPIVTNSGDTVSTPAAVTVTNVATSIVAANTSRNGVLIQNNSTSEDLYIGDSGVTTATGIKVSPGDSIALDTGGAIYGIRGGSTNINVRVLELKD